MLLRKKDCVKVQFSEIYAKTNRSIYGAAVSGTRSFTDADDVFQETYIELLQELEKGRKIENPGNYLLTILKRRLSAYYKAKSRTDDIFDYVMSFDDAEEPADELDIEDSIITDSLYDEVIEVLKQKDGTVQSIFYLYYRMQLSLPDIAARLDLNVSTVKNKLYRTLKELRKHYKEVP